MCHEEIVLTRHYLFSRFNRKYHYPYVFLNDEPFTDTFIKSIRQLTDAPTEFGLVPDTMWSVPDWVDENEVEEALADYASRNILYGGSLSYRHMCRFNSGFFYNHPLVAKYDYYWYVYIYHYCLYKHLVLDINIIIYTTHH